MPRQNKQENKTMRTIVALLIAVVMLTSMVSASELSDYNYLVTHQDSPRNIQMLDDFAYHMGGRLDMNTRMYNVANDKMIHVNMYWKYNPATGNLDWSGYFENPN